MTRYLAANQGARYGLFSLASALVWTFFLACLGLYGPTLTGAGAATISIPGAVSVIIQPSEALADGARWSVDGGPAQTSGASVTNLTAGAHTVQFSNLAAWHEPDAAQLLVIGGKQATVTATYRPLPRFYFRDVPGQSVRVGKVLEFLVRRSEERRVGKECGSGGS